MDDALQLIFGQTRSPGYLDANRAFDESFGDLKACTRSRPIRPCSMRWKMLVEDLDPQAVAEATASEGGIGGLIVSRKAKLWDAPTSRAGRPRPLLTRTASSTPS